MLVLKRYEQQHRDFPKQSLIRIECPGGQLIEIELLAGGNGWGRIGIDAPKEFVVYRQEYYDRLQQRYAEAQANSEAATEDLGSAARMHREEQ